jgi:hypothetical protein
MTDEKVEQSTAQQETLQSAETESGRSLVGKIARLPNKIREELNQRLQDGQDGTEVAEQISRVAGAPKTRGEAGRKDHI